MPVASLLAQIGVRYTSGKPLGFGFANIRHELRYLFLASTQRLYIHMLDPLYHMLTY